MKNEHAMKAYGLGVRRRRHDKTLDVFYPLMVPVPVAQQQNKPLLDALNDMARRESSDASSNASVILNASNLKTLATLAAEQDDFSGLSALKNVFASKADDTAYFEMDLVLSSIGDADAPTNSTEDAYFRLHCLSRGFFMPHELSLENLFEHLPTIAWTNKGPVLPEDVAEYRMRLLSRGELLDVSHIDKFPYLVNYFVPKGVRIAKGSQVRLGAYLGEGTTVMPSGYVNFNAAVMGRSMVEGRVSAGVVVETDSDIGGGASVMGTLSGGGKETIRIGNKCLIGANAGTGISLGEGCTIAAGTYITAGTKVSMFDANREPIDLDGKPTSEPGNVVKAKKLSNRSHLLYLRDSVSGKVVCMPNKKPVELNKTLHQNE